MTPIRLFRFLSKRDDVGAEEFEARWRADYERAALTAAGAVEYVRNVVSEPSMIAGKHCGVEFTASEEWLFGRGEDALAWMHQVDGDHSDPGGQQRFLKTGDCRWLATREHVLLNGPPRTAADVRGGIKLVVALSRRTDVALDSFADHWLNRHAPIIMSAAGTARYTICVPLAEAYAADAQPPFDGVAELWWRTEADFARYGESPSLDEVPADEAHFVDATRPFWSSTSRDCEECLPTAGPPA